ncbi:hypothetical protein FXO38_03913 [Capsicum annuum]|nr:hypothetical protein FXO38_03913 [Capsicum annuum]
MAKSSTSSPNQFGGSDYYTLKFKSAEEINFVLSNVPWFVYGHYLSIQRWEPNFIPAQAIINSSAIWIRLPHSPIKYYDSILLQKVGNSTTLRGRYARLCIQIPFDISMPNWIQIGCHRQQIIYEAEGLLSKNCGHLGHTIKECLFKTPNKDFSVKTSSIEHIQEASNFTEKTMNPKSTMQEWQTVQFPKKKKHPTVNQDLAKQVVIMVPTMRPCRITHLYTSIVQNPTITLIPIYQDASFVVWNTRRFNNDNFKRKFKELIPNHNPCLVALLETKMTNHNSLRGEFSFDEYIKVPAIGNSGGMVLMWYSNALQVGTIIFGLTIGCHSPLLSVALFKLLNFPLNALFPYDWNIFFPFALWYLWINRNNNIFNHDKSLLKIDIVTNKVLKFVHITSTDPSHNCSITLHLKWLKPPTGQLKLNINGSFHKATSKRGIGGVIRNSNGDWQLGFTGFCLENHPTIAELQALKSGLELALLHKIYPIETDIDSTDVIDLLNSSSLSDELCRSLLKKLGNPVLRHTFCQLNMVADLLCKFGAELPPSIPVTIFQTPPPQVISLLQAD